MGVGGSKPAGLCQISLYRGLFEKGDHLSAYRTRPLNKFERQALRDAALGVLVFIAAATLFVLFGWPLLVYTWHYWMG
jgi:hypothetical protein